MDRGRRSGERDHRIRRLEAAPSAAADPAARLGGGLSPGTRRSWGASRAIPSLRVRASGPAPVTRTLAQPPPVRHRSPDRRAPRGMTDVRPRARPRIREWSRGRGLRSDHRPGLRIDPRHGVRTTLGLGAWTDPWPIAGSLPMGRMDPMDPPSRAIRHGYGSSERATMGIRERRARPPLGTGARHDRVPAPRFDPEASGPARRPVKRWDGT